MSTNLQIFDFKNILGYRNGSRDINRHVDEQDKLTHRIGALGQNRNMTLVNESGLYSLVLSSKLPAAKEFKRWVTSEVLPAIRKTGAYAINQDPHCRLAEYIIKCTMPEQVELLRDLYDVPRRSKMTSETVKHKSSINTLDGVKILKNSDIINSDEKYKTVDWYLDTHTIRAGSKTEGVYKSYLEFCKVNNCDARTRQAFVIRLSQKTRLTSYQRSVDGATASILEKR